MKPASGRRPRFVIWTASRRKPFLVAACLLLCSLTSAGAALAEPSAADRSAAQALFEQARDLMKQDKAAEACPKLEESQRLDPGVGTQFNLAECYVKMHRTASA